MKTQTLLFASILTINACSLSPKTEPDPMARLSNAAAHGLEVEATPEDQAREEVLAMPTDFEVSLDQDTYAWERARFFLENYGAGTTAPANAVVKVVGSRRGLASSPSQSAYTYEVFKDFISTGYRYSVRCVPGAGRESSEASLNAGNFARFIRDGKLELSLLVQ